MLFTVNIAQAKESLPEPAQEVLEQFMKYLDEGNEEIYYYMDSTNTNMYNNIQQYLHNTNINYKIKNITKNQEGSYTVKLKIDAQGKNWKVSGINVNVKIEDVSVYGYTVTETTLFDHIGAKNITKNVFSVLGIVGIVFIILIVIIISIVVIIIIVLKNKKNATSENKESIEEKENK